MKTRTTGERSRMPKSLLLLVIAAIAPPLNAHAGGSNSKSLPDSVQSIDLANPGSRELSHLSARREACEKSHKGGNTCSDIPSQSVVLQCNAYMNHNTKELKLKGSVEELADITKQLRHCLNTSGSCHWTKVDLSGIKQRRFVSYREKSGLAEFLTLLQEKCSESLTHISLEGLTLKQEDLKAIDGMSGLEYLNLRRTNLTGAEFKAAVGGRNTKLAKLQTLLVNPTKSGKVLPDLQYPRDFGFLPSITFFDGRITGPMGSKQQLAAQGAQLLAGKDPFSEDPTYFDDTWEWSPQFENYKRALEDIGRRMLVQSRTAKVAEAAKILKDHPEEEREAREEPTADDYFKMGNHFKGHPEVAQYFFEEAKNQARSEANKAKDFWNPSTKRVLEEKRKDKEAEYYESLFRYGRNLYKYREEFADKQDQEKQAEIAKNKITDASNGNVEDAKTWLYQLKFQNWKATGDHSMLPNEYIRDRGTDSIVAFIKQRYITDKYGCTLKEADLTGFVNPRFQYGRKLKLADLLSLLRKECKGLQRLVLNETHLTDQDVKEISQMDQLKTLSLNDISLSSSQLKVLGQMDRLQGLDLTYSTGGNHLSQSHLERYILPMRGLNNLDVRGAYLNGRGSPALFKRFEFEGDAPLHPNDAQIFTREPKHELKRE